MENLRFSGNRKLRKMSPEEIERDKMLVKIFEKQSQGAITDRDDIRSQKNLLVVPSSVRSHRLMRKLKLNNAYCTRPGRSGWNKPAKQNQDNFVIQENLTNNLSLFAVCDGHGQHGAKVSLHVKQMLPFLMMQYLQN